MFAQVTGATGQSVEQFYSERTITLVVPAATGGINDLAGRLVARHISRFIPGHPTIVPENRASEGGNGLLNEFAATTPRDGSVIGVVQLSPYWRSRLIRRRSSTPRPLHGWAASRPSPTTPTCSW